MKARRPTTACWGWQAAGARLDQEGMEDEEVVAVDEEHLGLVLAQAPGQALDREGAAETAADHDDARAVRFPWSDMAVLPIQDYHFQRT